MSASEIEALLAKIVGSDKDLVVFGVQVQNYRKHFIGHTYSGL